jgi:D-glycero-alpha-D-manno-heptose 1-phosphate guanylyltransferase
VQAIILAGGLGTRLRDHIGDIPKAMSPIAGHPFLAWLLGHLRGNGFRRVILSVGYLADVIRDQFGARFGDLEILYAAEESPLGTGGAIRGALRFAADDGKPVWIMNGDTIVELSFDDMWRAHRARPNSARSITMALKSVDDGSRFGSVGIRNGRVAEFAPSGRAGPTLINSGVYLLDREIFDAWPMPAAFSFEKEFLAPNIDQLWIWPFLTEGWFLDIGVATDLVRAQTEFPSRLRVVWP